MNRFLKWILIVVFLLVVVGCLGFCFRESQCFFEGGSNTYKS